MKKSQDLTLFRVLPSQNIRTYSKNFYMVFGYRLGSGIVKISLKNLNSKTNFVRNKIDLKAKFLIGKIKELISNCF